MIIGSKTSPETGVGFMSFWAGGLFLSNDDSVRGGGSAKERGAGGSDFSSLDVELPPAFGWFCC